MCSAAMGFHGVIRATEDVDLFVRATPQNVERLRDALRPAYDGDPSIDEIQDADLLGDYPSVRYYPPSGDLYFDILTRLGEAVSFETVEYELKVFRFSLYRAEGVATGTRMPSMPSGLIPLCCRVPAL